MRQIFNGAVCQIALNLVGKDASFRTDQGGKNCAVVTGSSTNVHDQLAVDRGASGKASRM
jgi:hypothetical protein